MSMISIRRVLPWLVVAFLAAAAVVSIRKAMADDTVGEINRALYEARLLQAKSGVAMDDANWQYLLSESKRAVMLAPDNGHYWYVMSRVYTTPRSANGTAISPDYAGAYRALTHAVVALPSSGYVWSGLAYAADHLFAQNQLPGGQAALERTIQNALMLGPREPEVLSAIVDLGLANWQVLGQEAKHDVQRAITNLALRHQQDVIAIASRRGALPVVCREPAVSKHTACLATTTNASEAKTTSL